MKKEAKAELILILTTMIWGVGFPLTSLALNGIGPYTLVAARSLLASGALIIICGKKIRCIDWKTVKSGTLIAITLTVGNLLQTAGMLYTTPSKSSFVTGFTVIFVPIILAVGYKKLPGSRVIIGAFISVIGLLMLTYNGDKGINIGDVLTLLCAIVYSFQILLVDKFGKEADGLTMAAVELLVVGLLSLLPAFFMEGCQVKVSPIVVVAILITGLLGSGLGMAAQNIMQPYLNPSHAAIIYLFEPVFGVIFSTFIGDILSPRAIIGCILILIAMFISGRE